MLEKAVICKHCGKPEYYGQMHWLNGKCMCRSCYKQYFREYYGMPYTWSDLDGPRPNNIEELTEL